MTTQARISTARALTFAPDSKNPDISETAKLKREPSPELKAMAVKPISHRAVIAVEGESTFVITP
jgi:hypothetical protein